MSKTKLWRTKVEELRAGLVALNDKKEFYEREVEYYEQQLDEAESMLIEAQYMEGLSFQTFKGNQLRSKVEEDL